MSAISEKQKSIFEMFNSGIRGESEPAVEKSAADRLEELKKTCLACSRCALRQGCRQVVFGDGSSGADLLFIGEGPGADEDRIGVPFVGKAGQLLDRIFEAARIDREEVYIANVVKCRPPGNRLPLQPEVDCCLPYLKKQIELIDPVMIVCLGALAMRTLIDKNASITRIRGKWFEKDGRKITATFHPAALLRDPGKKKDVWEDFKQIVQIYRYGS